jgi:Tfp pilus assembly protein PilV
MLRGFRNEKGWLLAETMIGVFILTTALFAILYGYQMATISTVSAHQRNNAVFLAQQALEELRVNDGANTFTQQPERTETIENITYAVVPDYTIANYASINNEIQSSILHPVRVTVRWTDPKTLEARSVSLATYYYTAPN